MLGAKSSIDLSDAQRPGRFRWISQTVGLTLGHDAMSKEVTVAFSAAQHARLKQYGQFPMTTPITLTTLEVAEILATGNFRRFLSTIEHEHVECKRSLYQLKEQIQKIE